MIYLKDSAEARYMGIRGVEIAIKVRNEANFYCDLHCLGNLACGREGGDWEFVHGSIRIHHCYSLRGWRVFKSAIGAKCQFHV